MNPTVGTKTNIYTTLFVLACIVIVGGVFLATMPRGMYWGDGLELTTAAHCLGIPHPTGYPLYMLIGKLFASFPAGTVAWRLHLSSLCFVAATTVILFFLFRLLALRLFPPEVFPDVLYTNSICLAFSLLFAFSRTVWRLGTITEVYALHILFFVTTIYLGCLYLFTKRRRYFLGVFLIVIISLTHHMMSVVAVPFVLVCVGVFLFSGLSRKDKIKSAGLCVLLLVIAFMLFLYLPVRAHKHPPINWGNPENMRNFLWVINGGDFKDFYFLQFPAGHHLDSHTLVPYIKLRLAGIYNWFLSEWFNLSTFGNKGRILGTLFFVVVCGIGLVYMGIRKILLAIALLCTLILTVAVVFFYGIYDIEDYFISAIPLLLIPFFIGLMRLLNLFESYFLGRKFNYLNWVAFVLPMMILVTNFSANNRRLDSSADKYSQRLFQSLERDSIVITFGDNDIYSLWYRQKIQGERPDVLVVGGNFIYSEWYRTFFREKDLKGRRIHIEKQPISTEEVFYRDLRNWIIEPNIGRFPIYTTTASPFLEEWYEAEQVAVLLHPDEFNRVKARFLPSPYLYRLRRK